MASTRQQAWLLRHRNGAGLLKTHVKARVSSRFLSYDLFDDFTSPAEEIFFLIPRFENVTVMLYEDGELKKTVFPDSDQTESSAFSLRTAYLKTTGVNE